MCLWGVIGDDGCILLFVSWLTAKGRTSTSCASDEREKLTLWLRDVDDLDSAQALQIKYALSIPSPGAIKYIGDLPLAAIVSLGCGTAYWESLMAAMSIVIPVDNESWYPRDMLHMPILPGSVDILQRKPEDIFQDYAIRAASDNRFAALSQRLQSGLSENAVTWDNVGLFLAWPDDSEACSFGLECVQQFRGHFIIHVGERIGPVIAAP
eukprot:TRINITY_DN10193_c0_g2_i3.p1 TRINITY_DN10193_c0_g2~~TRINITY_DN10193_c0_g2_i3.p1  ORF type:complete len:210 (-),score=8.75 TRINITY_DN10193_c0_g2_i3:74-703(-)